MTGPIAIFGVCALVMLGCSSTDTPPQVAGSAQTVAPGAPSTAEQERTASAPGVTADEIHLGVVAIDFDTLRDLGLVDFRRGDPQKVVDAFVGELNDRGGIGGRLVRSTVVEVSPVSNTAAEEACLQLTEDDRVFAVLGGFTGPAESVQPCIYDRHETILIGGTQTPERLADAKAPWLTTKMSANRRLEATIDLLNEQGRLPERVGVSVAAVEDDLFERVVEPALAKRGVTAVKVQQDVDNADVVAGQNQWEVFVEKFRSEGIDAVLLMESTATFGVEQLLAAGFDGTFSVLDTNDIVVTYGGSSGVEPEAFDGVVGSMRLTGEEAWSLEANQRCVEVFEAANPDITVVRSDLVPQGEEDWMVTILQVCSDLAIFEQLAAEAGADLTNETFAAALTTIDLEIPGRPFVSGGPDKFDFDNGLRLGEFDHTLGPGGSGRPITDYADVTAN